MITKTAAEILTKHVKLELESIDRIYLNVYQPILQTGGGIAYFFKKTRNAPIPSSALMSQMTHRFKAEIDRFVTEEDIEIVRFRKGDRKDDITQQKLSNHHGNEGVLYMGIAQEKAFIFRTISALHPESGKPMPWLGRSTVMCNHYYFYLVDDDFGPLFIKICSYFPYTIRVCLNGHEYLKRQLEKKGIGYEPLDNGILSCESPQEMQKIANGLDAVKIEGVIRKWLKKLPSPFSQHDRECGFNYEISILQSEFALTQVFDKPIQGRQYFEQVIRENIDLGRPENVSLIFGRRVTKRTPGQFRTRIITHEVIPSLHVSYKHSKIKQYFKESRALRTETVINNTRDFDIGRKIENLEKLKQLAFPANRRLLDVEKSSQDCISGAKVFEEVTTPVQKGKLRVSGLKFGDPRSVALMTVLCTFVIAVMGFTNKELRNKVAALMGKSTDAYNANMMTYDLRRLKLHGLIERTPQSNRYVVTRKGLQICLYFTKVYARLFVNGMGQVVDQPCSLEKRPLRLAMNKLDKAINDEIINQQLLVA